MNTTEAQIKTLEKELAKLKRQQNKPPEPLQNPDFSKLRQLVIDITNHAYPVHTLHQIGRKT
jgi:hypothetical protein